LPCNFNVPLKIELPCIIRESRVSFIVEDLVENNEETEDDHEGGLNWLGAFKGGIVSGIMHILKYTESKTIMLLAFDILFNMIEHHEVF